MSAYNITDPHHWLESVRLSRLRKFLTMPELCWNWTWNEAVTGEVGLGMTQDTLA